MKAKPFILALSSLALLSSCGGGSSSAPEGEKSEPVAQTTPSYAVTFDLNYEGAPAPTIVNVARYEAVAEPATPTRVGYSFVAWCEDKEGLTPFDFTTYIMAEWTLYASWKVGGAPITESSEPTVSSVEESSEEQSSVISEDPGKEYVDYYLNGTFTSPAWGDSVASLDKTYRLYKDKEEGSTNVGVIENVSLKAGDTFKVVGTEGGVISWFGGDASQANSTYEVETSGLGSGNIVIKTGGLWKIYLSSSKVVYPSLMAD